MTVPKIQHPDDRSRVWVAPLLRREQDDYIVRIIEEFTTGTMSALDASDPGVGKTAVAAEVIIRMGLQNILYVGIRDTFREWADRLEAQSDGVIQLRRMDTTAPGRKAFADFRAGVAGHYFTGSQFLGTADWTRVPVLGNDGEPTFKDGRPVTKRKHLGIYKKLPLLDLIVYDEVHVVSNRKSNGIGTVKSVPTIRKHAMSGTFYGEKFPGAHTICRWLWPTALTSTNEFIIDPSVARWTEEWCSTETPIGRNGKPVADPRGKPIKKILGEKNPGEFVSTLPLYLRAESPVGKEPDPELIWTDLTPGEWRDYSQISEEGVAWLETHPGIEPIVANLPPTKRQRMRTATLGTMSLRPTGKFDEHGQPEREIYFHTETESSKMGALRQLLDRPDWAKRQVAIYLFSKKFAHVLVERMRRGGFNAVEWSGDVSSKQRDEIKRQFLAGEVQYIVAVIPAFGTGLDGFQKVCNRVAWIEESESAKDNLQAIRRFWRPGGDLADFQHAKILARDTIDDETRVRNDGKTELARETMRLAS